VPRKTHSKQKHGLPPRPLLLAPRRHHLDRYGASLAAELSGGDDDLLTTREMAEWLRCSEAWLARGRRAGFGPPFERITPKMIRYKRGKARVWLESRTQHYAEGLAS
jgi:hypothetical protein